MSESEPYQLMPPLGDEEYQSLKADIRLRGCLTSLEFDDLGNLLDGHHRHRIISELREEGIRVDFTSIIRPGLTEQEKRAHIRALNIYRRHLTPAQRRELIADQLRDTPERSDRLVAAELHVDRETVGRVRDELESTGGIPPVVERVGADGKTRRKPGSASVIAKSQRETERALEALDGLRPDALPGHAVDVKLLERIRRETDSAERAKGVEKAPSVIGSTDIRLGDFREVLRDIPAGSADLILTDPPYAREFLPLWDDLGAFAARVLRPSGLLVAYAGQDSLPAIMASLSNHLDYVWIISQAGRGRKVHNYNRRIYVNWKPILVFAKPPFQPDRWWDDLLQGDGGEKDRHEWQQREDEARWLVETFSRPNDIVIDPMLVVFQGRFPVRESGMLSSFCEEEAHHACQETPCHAHRGATPEGRNRRSLLQTFRPGTQTRQNSAARRHQAG